MGSRNRKPSTALSKFVKQAQLWWHLAGNKDLRLEISTFIFIFIYFQGHTNVMNF
jgi:hypothetical protein